MIFLSLRVALTLNRFIPLRSAYRRRVNERPAPTDHDKIKEWPAGVAATDALCFVGEQLVLVDSDRLLLSSLTIFCDDNDL